MNKEKLNEIRESLSGVNDALCKLNSVVSHGPATYYFERIMEYFDGCMAASKFKVGDRVELVEDVDTSDAPGWNNSKHFLIKGAKATVDEVDYYNGKYRYSVVFDDETWINTKGEKVPTEKKHYFTMSESDFVSEVVSGDNTITFYEKRIKHLEEMLEKSMEMNRKLMEKIK